jgi:hypothetical protein
MFPVTEADSYGETLARIGALVISRGIVWPTDPDRTFLALGRCP